MAKQGKQSKQSRPVPDARRIYQLAERYTEASELLSQQAKGGDYGSGPMLLVDSFAVELYLKCLYVCDNNEAPPQGREGHDWKGLFDGLKSHTKAAVRDVFNEIVRQHPVLANLSLVNPLAPPVTDFDASLVAGAETFAKRRYMYENIGSGGWFYAHLIRDAVRKVTKLDLRVASIQPTPSPPVT